ncbi:hypothetical protein PL81_20370 [Streptomyces sp. RSD-27]|nr:hypothetical protein PL81_20370 [Streptomyces sp. RSD-27]
MSIPVFMREAPCSRIDPELMFPAPSDLAKIEEAKSTCAECPFQIECLEWALDPASRCVFGVFGGKTEAQRKALVKKRKLGKPLRPDYGPRPAADRRIPASA